MSSTTSRMISKHGKTRVIAAGIVLCICILVPLVILIGRTPISGHIAVSQNESDRFAQIMKENRIVLWTGIGSMGMMGVEFDNPFAFSSIDDVILDDARRNNYKAIVKYKCLIPYFNHVVIVN